MLKEKDKPVSTEREFSKLISICKLLYQSSNEV